MTDKANLLCILKVLQEYSDENHIMSMRDIIARMKNDYDKTIDRRTVYSAMDTLAEFGYEISRYEDNGKGYYLIDRDFSIAEVRLLMDAIYSCEYISQKQTEELLQKLRSFLSVHERKNYTYTNIVAADKKSPNPEVFLNIEILDEAISAGKKVAFTYMDYDYDKKLKPRREAKYVVSPYSMICESEHYYLVLIADGHSEPSFYRIDMMKNIEILDERLAISKRDARLDSAKKVIYAHTGEPEQIHLHCQKIALRYVIERFGNDVTITENKDGSFEAYFRAAPEGLVYWALQYLQSVEVIQPKSVRDAVIKAINESHYK